MPKTCDYKNSFYLIVEQMFAFASSTTWLEKFLRISNKLHDDVLRYE